MRVRTYTRSRERARNYHPGRNRSRAFRGDDPPILISSNLINGLRYSITRRRRRRRRAIVDGNPWWRYGFRAEVTQRSPERDANERHAMTETKSASLMTSFFSVSYQFQRQSTRNPPTTFPAYSGWRRPCSHDRDDGSLWRSQRPPAARRRTRTPMRKKSRLPFVEVRLI